MVRDTHNLRRSILSHLENTANYTSLSELEDIFPSVTPTEVTSAVNFLKMVKMVEVEDGLIAKTESDHATPVAQLYNQLKVGKTYDRKQITVEVKRLNIPISPANCVAQLVQHGGLNKKSGNSFKCITLPNLLGVTLNTLDADKGAVEIVSANRRVVWEALSEAPKTRNDLYEELIPLYPSLNKIKIWTNLDLLSKQGCVDLDYQNNMLATQLNYIPFEADMLYHEIKCLKTIKFNQAQKICAKVGLNAKTSNLLRSLTQMNAIAYTSETGVFDILPLPQLEVIEQAEVIEQVEQLDLFDELDLFEEVEEIAQIEASIDDLFIDVKQAKQVFKQTVAEHDLKVKEVSTLRKKIEVLTKKADELESEIHSEVNLAKQKLESAQSAFKKALSNEGLID